MTFNASNLLKYVITVFLGCIVSRVVKKETGFALFASPNKVKQHLAKDSYQSTQVTTVSHKYVRRTRKKKKKKSNEVKTPKVQIKEAGIIYQNIFDLVTMAIINQLESGNFVQPKFCNVDQIIGKFMCDKGDVLMTVISTLTCAYPCGLKNTHILSVFERKVQENEYENLIFCSDGLMLTVNSRIQHAVSKKSIFHIILTN